MKNTKMEQQLIDGNKELFEKKRFKLSKRVKENIQIGLFAVVFWLTIFWMALTPPLF